MKRKLHIKQINDDLYRLILKCSHRHPEHKYSKLFCTCNKEGQVNISKAGILTEDMIKKSKREIIKH